MNQKSARLKGAMNRALFVLILTLCGSGSALAFMAGDGSPENPYQVATAAQLDAVRDHPASAFVQVAHINLGIAPWNEGAGWVPLNTEEGREGGTASFSGVYDGNGFSIMSLTIDHDFDDGEEQAHWTTRPWGGLFDTIAESGVVRNVTLAGGVIRGGYLYSAPLAGINQGLVENCHASTGVMEAYELVGGLVGDNEGTIRNSSASGSVLGGSSVGGLAGGNFGLIENSSASGNVRAEMHSVGGLVGANEGGTIHQGHASGAVSFYHVEENDYFNGIGGLVGDNTGDGRIESSHATGDVNGVGNPENPSSGTGGLVGNNDWSEIIDSRATGHVSGQQSVGGLVGFNIGQIERSRATGNVEGWDKVGGLVGASHGGGHAVESYAVGEVSGDNNVGGLVGELTGGAFLFNSFAHGSVSGADHVGGLVGATFNGDIISCYSTGLVSLENTGSAGGLVGYRFMETGMILKSYWNSETSGQESGFGGEGRTTAQMTYPHDAGTYVDWNFTEIWAADTGGTQNNGYPYLQFSIPESELLANPSFDEPDGAGWQLAEQALRSMVFEQPGIADLHVGGGFTGCVIWQDLNVPLAGGATFEVLMRLSRANAPDGNSTHVRLVYEDAEGQQHALTVLEPDNGEVAFMPDATTFTASATLPADAVKLVTFCVYRADFGQFHAHGFSLKQSPLDTDPELVEYHEWAEAIPDPEQRGDHDTPAGDGIPNLLKFASGLDPMTAYTPADVMRIYEPGSEVVVMGGMQVEPKGEESSSLPFAILFYRSKSAAGVHIFAEHNTRLVKEDWGMEGVTEELIGEDGARETWKATAPPGTRGFMRLKAVRD